MKTLVLVDFDKTLYKKDSLIEFTIFYKGNFNFFFGLIVLLPSLLKWKCGIISNDLAKQIFITYFFKNEDYTLFLDRGKEFSTSNISKNINQTILKSILKHQENKADLYIVTASFKEWISDWSKLYNIELITTEFEIYNNKITGNFKTKNCNGVEKVSRIQEKINLKTYDKIVVFGKGKGDYEMLQLQK